MQATLLEPRADFWRCPSCHDTVRCYLGIRPEHKCKALDNLTVPLEWVNAPDAPTLGRHKLLAREDYQGKSLGQPLLGKQVLMGVRLERPDGSYDANAFAECPNMDLRALMGGPGAWSASAVFAYAVMSSLKKAMQWVTDTIMVALYNNTGTPSQSVTTAVLTEYNGSASQWVTANEVSQAVQWPAGGVALAATIAVTQSTNVITFSGGNTASGAAATLAAGYGCLVYDSSVSNQGLCYNYFGGSNSVTAGTFTVTWSGSGIATFTC